jgi:imidazolonepropionase-like amidohydrolase
MRLLMLCLFLEIAPLILMAQKTFPVNGPANESKEIYAITHCKAYINSETIINNCTLLIQDGKILDVGQNIAIPKNAIEINATGKTIYPGFIDLYSNYGISYQTNNKDNKGYQQFLSSKKGAYNWNEAIRSEYNAADFFSPDEGRNKFYLDAGFGAVLTGLQDGICRGSSALVFSASLPAHHAIIKANAAAGFSFQKGSSSQDYPSSLMGSIALIRQTYYDAQWYAKQKNERNISLEKFNSLRSLPAIFSAENKFSILRAQKIASEFNANYYIKTAGDDYQRADEIKNAGCSLIIPMSFPKAPDVEDPLDAEMVSTKDMKHWELAPFNAAILFSKKIPFCITSEGCATAKEFLQNIRKAVEMGLDQTYAIKALTQNPAAVLGVQTELGELKKGMYANLIICSGNFFSKDVILYETWSMGKRHVMRDLTIPDYTGQYFFEKGDLAKSKLIVSERDGKQNWQLVNTDTLNGKYDDTYRIANVSFPNKKGETLYRMAFTLLEIDSSSHVMKWACTIFYPDGKTSECNAIRIGNVNTKSSNKDTVVAYDNSLLLFPFNDYGTSERTSKPSFTIFKNATVWTSENEGVLYNTDVAIQQGKIIAVGNGLTIENAKTIDATDMHLTAGIIDEHSHIAIQNGVNEGTQAVTSEVRIGDVINPDDINIYRQLAGGVTAAQLLHGSANPIGGQSAVIKLKWGSSADDMKILVNKQPVAFIKFALGENVKQSNWGDRAITRYPQTRMGVEQIMYDAFIRAKEYDLLRKQSPEIYRRDLELDALCEILDGKRNITCHSYVQSEINMLMHLADSMKFKINTFTHILEGYKVADKMKIHGASASTFADWWAYKYEVIEAIPYNAALLHKMGITTAINSDDAEMGRRLNQEAAKIIKYGNVSENDAWKMVTLNPARMLHIDHLTGSIKKGKDADLVLWNTNPLSIYAKPISTYVDGVCMYNSQTDIDLRESIRKERQRLIAKLIKAKHAGEKTEKIVSDSEPNYHCND